MRAYFLQQLDIMRRRKPVSDVGRDGHIMTVGQWVLEEISFDYLNFVNLRADGRGVGGRPHKYREVRTVCRGERGDAAISRSETNPFRRQHRAHGRDGRNRSWLRAPPPFRP